MREFSIGSAVRLAGDIYVTTDPDQAWGKGVDSFKLIRFGEPGAPRFGEVISQDADGSDSFTVRWDNGTFSPGVASWIRNVVPVPPLVLLAEQADDDDDGAAPATTEC